MITGKLKNKIDKIWETFWTGGITNPLDVIEQFTYLLFMKQLDEVETQREADAMLLGYEPDRIFADSEQEYRWSRFKDLGKADAMYELVQEKVFPFIKNLHSDEQSAYARYMGDAIFKIPTAGLLSKIVDGIDDLNIQEAAEGGDSKGDLYEYLLSKVATAGTNGQFRTPRHIIQMMVEMVKPNPSDKIIDPAMGSAGFLCEAQTFLRKHHHEIFLDENLRHHFNNDMFYGNDMDTTMLRIGAMNMMLHGVENPNISYRDSLSAKNEDVEKYSLVLANPPFKGSLDADGVSASLLKMTKTKKTELLFLALFLRILQKGGRAAVIVPDGVLFGSSKAHKQIRQELVDNNKLQAVVSMPSGVFKPYAGVSTAILFFTKTGAGGTDKVWFYDMKSDGLSLDDKRQPVEANDIPDIIERYENLAAEESRQRTEQSFMVPVEEIRDNGYDLSINKYKEIVYEKIEYEPTSVILGRINDLEIEIKQELKELQKLLAE